MNGIKHSKYLNDIFPVNGNISYNQEYFCNGNSGNPSGSTFLEDASRNCVPESFFLGIDVTNTFPPSTELLVTMRFGTYLL
jgi:hypothetical protein